MKNATRVVITGMGVVSPCGMEETVFWSNLISGRTGIRHMQSVDVSALRCPNGGEVDTADFAAVMEKREWKPFGEPLIDMSMMASHQALEQSGVIRGTKPFDPQPIAVLFGTANGPSKTVWESYKTFFERGARAVRPTIVPRCMVNIAPSFISMEFKLTGIHYSVVAACSSATAVIGMGYRMIKDGYAEQVLCAAADSFFTPAIYGAWNNLGVMSMNPDASRASRPFDRDRDGFVMGEGAGSFLLESLECSQRRGAKPRCEIIGYGESSDAMHITQPNPAGQALAMRAALASAGITPKDVGFINAHGTSTKANDETECATIRNVFGEEADRIPVASNKSFFGHAMGASGALELATCILGLENGVMPPNLNLDNPDPVCNVRLVGKDPMPIQKPIIMKNSFGFGGANCVLVVRNADF